MNKKIALFAMTAALALPIAPAFAADSTTETPKTNMQSQRDANLQLREQNQAAREQNQTEKTQLQDQRQKNMQDRCTNIQTKIGDRVTKIEDNKARFATAFGNMQARLQQL